MSPTRGILKHALNLSWRGGPLPTYWADLASRSNGEMPLFWATGCPISHKMKLMDLSKIQKVFNAEIYIWINFNLIKHFVIFQGAEPRHAIMHQVQTFCDVFYICRNKIFKIENLNIEIFLLNWGGCPPTRPANSWLLCSDSGNWYENQMYF